MCTCRRILMFGTVLATGLFLLIGSPSWAATPPLDMESALIQAASAVCNPPDGCSISGFQRTVIVPGIVHYSALVQVGPGEYDRIGIHRVVQENRPGYPIKVVGRVMLQHGDAKDFVGMFLPGVYSPGTPVDFGCAIYLARGGIDVWGIDQGWTLVPLETQHFEFMKEWGLQWAVDNLSTALAIARETRRLSGASDEVQ